MTLTKDILLLSPEMILAVIAMAFLMYGAFQGNKVTRQITSLSVLSLVALAGSFLIADFWPSHASFTGFFISDSFSSFAKVLILIGSAFALYMSSNYNDFQNITRFEYPVLILLATVGMMLMVSANDFLSLYVGVELQSLSLYVIAAIRRDQLRSSEAGLKYFVLGALSSGLLLYGISLIYGFSGTTSFTGLYTILASIELSVPLIFGMVFVIAGLAFKISAVPFHMWTPDVYEGSATPVTAFFSVAPKIAAMCLVTRVLSGPFGPMFDEWQQVVICASVLSMVVGSVAALRQTNIKRLMAYSSIGHVGFALLGVMTWTDAGVRSLLMYMIIYLFMNVGVFAVILSLRVNNHYIREISDLSGLSKTYPFLSLLMTIFMFSMAGIPPLAGFFAKFYVLLNIVEAELYWVAILAVLSSVIAAYYYLRIIKVIYFDEQLDFSEFYYDKSLRPVLAITGGFVTFFFILPMPFMNWAMTAALSLFAS